jgi:N-sulfoglucosamine sulfohydrolase
MINKKLLTCGLAAVSAAVTAQGQDPRPNILLILSDDHSAPYLGCYGDPDLKTPNLDRMAGDGILFSRAYVSCPQSVPSRATILTGRNVLDIDMLNFASALDRDVVTGPEILREQGYFTGLCGRIYHLDGMGPMMGPERREVVEEYGLITFPDRVDYCKVAVETPDKILEQFEEFLDLAPKDKPFFLQTNFSDPHRDFTAPDFEPDPASLHIPPTMPDTRLLREDLAGHHGEIQRLDHSMGEIFRSLEKRGLDNNTIVIFMGDNGSALLRGKGTLYELGIRVPLIIKWPGVINPGSVSNILVSGEDIVPTILDVAGIKPPEEVTGFSLVPACKGEEKPVREYIFAVRGPHGSNLPNKTMNPFDMGRVVLDKKYKLIYNPLYYLYYSPIDCFREPFWLELVELDKQGKLDARFSQTILFAPERPMFELFDTESDPGEFSNLIGKPDYADVEYRLKKALNEWMIVYRDVVPSPFR